MGDVIDSASNAGRQAKSSAWMDYAVRFGLITYGVVHLLIAWLSIQLALGDRKEWVSGSGALSELVTQPFGRTMVWLVAAGMALLVVAREMLVTAIRAPPLSKATATGASATGTRPISA